jgi:signal transduction histidine kinase
VETLIFRVALEALTNVRKHARTTRAHLELLRQERELRLVVQDWGRGFDPALPPMAGLGERIGLRGMRERIALLGGRCDIDSEIGVGTRVIATVPLPVADQRDACDAK